MDVKLISKVDVATAYREVASTQEGQIVIQDLLRRFGYSRASTIDVDPLRMAWKEGGRAVMVHMGYMLEADLDELRAQETKQGEM